MFELHPRLKADTIELKSLDLCRVLLMNNALFPWILLVPQQNGLTEITDLERKTRTVFMEEIAWCCDVMQQCFKPDKMNVATLGNQVPQLHIHVIARFATDRAWPNPVWGIGSRAYTANTLANTISHISKYMKKFDTCLV